MSEIKEIEFNITVVSKFCHSNGSEKSGDSISQTSGRMKANKESIERAQRIVETLLSKIGRKKGFFAIIGESFVPSDGSYVESKKYVITYDITKYFDDGSCETEEKQETIVDERGCQPTRS